jgi:acetolactate decarboxylase
MAQDLIDDRLIGALHVQAMGRRAFIEDPTIEHVTFQAGTLNGLMDGHLRGDATLGDLLLHGDHGIGTVQNLAGELVIVDGAPFVINGDGVVDRVSEHTRTPFAVICQFNPQAHAELTAPLGLAQLRDVVDALALVPEDILAIRVDGQFGDLRLRSVHAQKPPYPSLLEVTEHQTEWTVSSARGTVVGFRFPDRMAGVEVPGHHLHFLSDDLTHGGHVLDLTLIEGHAMVDSGKELHVELPDHIELGVPGAADRAAIRMAEGG